MKKDDYVFIWDINRPVKLKVIMIRGVNEKQVVFRRGSKEITRDPKEVYKTEEEAIKSNKVNF